MKKFILITSLISTSLFALNLNTASMQELEKIKGIGPQKAKAIIDYRKTHKIKSADDLKNIKGFDENTIANVKNNVMTKKHLSKIQNKKEAFKNKIDTKKENLKNKKESLKNKKAAMKEKLNSKKENKNSFKNKLKNKKLKAAAKKKALKNKKAAYKNKINNIKNKKTNLKNKIKLNKKSFKK